MLTIPDLPYFAIEVNGVSAIGEHLFLGHIPRVFVTEFDAWCSINSILTKIENQKTKHRLIELIDGTINPTYFSHITLKPVLKNEPLANLEIRCK